MMQSFFCCNTMTFFLWCSTSFICIKMTRVNLSLHPFLVASAISLNISFSSLTVRWHPHVAETKRLLIHKLTMSLGITQKHNLLSYCKLIQVWPSGWYFFFFIPHMYYHIYFKMAILLRMERFARASLINGHNWRTIVRRFRYWYFDSYECIFISLCKVSRLVFRVSRFCVERRAVYLSEELSNYRRSVHEVNKVSQNEASTSTDRFAISFLTRKVKSMTGSPDVCADLILTLRAIK